MRRCGSKNPTNENIVGLVFAVPPLSCFRGGFAVCPRVGRSSCCVAVSLRNCPAAKPFPRKPRPASLPVCVPRRPLDLRLSRTAGLPARGPAAPVFGGPPPPDSPFCQPCRLCDPLTLQAALFLLTAADGPGRPLRGRLFLLVVFTAVRYGVVFLPPNPPLSLPYQDKERESVSFGGRKPT